MDNKQKFFICEKCGNLIGMIISKGGKTTCCGSEMKELAPNTVEASTEKHLPVASLSGGKLSVSVGSIPHPMEEEHNITFIYVETDRGGQRKRLDVGAAPVTDFSFTDDKPVAVYAYCNLHGLWKTEL